MVPAGQNQAPASSCQLLLGLQSVWPVLRPKDPERRDRLVLALLGHGNQHMKRIERKESEGAYHQDRRRPDLSLSVGLDVAPRGGGRTDSGQGGLACRATTHLRRCRYYGGGHSVGSTFAQDCEPAETAGAARFCSAAPCGSLRDFRHGHVELVKGRNSYGSSARTWLSSTWLGSRCYGRSPC